MSFEEFKKVKYESVLTLLGLHKGAHSGHIGSSLSCLDLLLYLHLQRMKPEDKFILSKGHAAAALYTVLYKSGKISQETLDTYYKDGTYLAAHPPCGKGKVDGIIFGTGSLGHGLSLATGLAFSNKYSDKRFKAYCVVSDGDCNEGSTWEAALFAAHHKLENLTVIIDHNGLQGLGTTEEVIGMTPIREKWEAFNFEVAEVGDGNDFISLQKGFDELDRRDSHKPRCIIAKTTKGNGVSFMENQLAWHYLPMDEDLYRNAIKEMEKKYA